MSKHIKLEDAIAKMDEWFCEPYTPTQLLSVLPAIDIVECDECLHKNECSRVVKNIDGTLTWLNWCSFGERIEQ